MKQETIININTENTKNTEQLLTLEDKLKLFIRIQQIFGCSALCLSGGATITFYQFGVIKALVDNNALPKIISGTSGGSLVGSGIAVRTDEELKDFLVPESYILLKACSESLITKIRRFVKTGYIFDWQDWRDKLRLLTKGDTTFKEAFENTGRIFNVTAVSDNHRPILLNYKSAPNVVIWSAVICSAALPLALKPSSLIEKDYNGNLIKVIRYGKCWSDGSILSDVPAQRLLEDFNVKYTICIQCNPHVIAFYYDTRGSINTPVKHRGLSGMRGGFFSAFIEKFLKLEMRKWMKLLSDLDLMPQLFGKDWRYTALQPSRGTITIRPFPVFTDYIFFLTDPTLQRMKHFIRHGEIITFPFLSMINNRDILADTLKEIITKLDYEAGGDGQLLNILLSQGSVLSYGNSNSNNNNNNNNNNNEYDTDGENGLQFVDYDSQRGCNDHSDVNGWIIRHPELSLDDRRRSI